VLEAQIKSQGDIVRTLKEKQKREEQLEEEALTTALAELLKLKMSLMEESAKS
jgi:methionyl-tRNA synthetase